MTFKWPIQAINLFLKPYLFVLGSDSLKVQARQVSRVLKSLLCLPIFVFPSTIPTPHDLTAQQCATLLSARCAFLFCSAVSWFHNAGPGTMPSCLLEACISNVWPCYTATIPFMKTTWSSDRKYYEWSGKAWENQRLKGLKFPSLIYLLLLPKGTQNPKGSSRPKPDYKNYGGFVFPLVGEWKPCYEPTINHNKPAAHG